MESCLVGLSLSKSPLWRQNWLPIDIYFKNCITKPRKVHQNESNTIFKLFMLKWLFLWLRMLLVSKPLNKGDFYETHAISYRLALIHFTCSSNVQPELYVSCVNTSTALTASRTSFSDTIMSCRKTAVSLKLSNVTYAEFFTSTTKILCW